MKLLQQLKGGVVVSCQPVDHGPMDRPDIIAAMAQAAIIGGACGVRVEGAQNVAAARERMTAPIVGIIKRDLKDSEVRITPFEEDIDALIEAGADIIAVDATARPRPVPLKKLLEHIAVCGKISMADCSTIDDARTAQDLGAQILGTTLSGYVGGNAAPTDAPDLDLVRQLATLGGFVMAEGRFNTPEMVREAFLAGANAVTVGSALTRLEIATSWFVQAAEMCPRK